MYNINLSEQEWNVVLNALGAQPYGNVYQIINKMQAQFAEAQKAADTPTPTEEPKAAE
jgi:hypothetical protein